jgi:hypothetical protein
VKQWKSIPRCSSKSKVKAPKADEAAKAIGVGDAIVDASFPNLIWVHLSVLRK